MSVPPQREEWVTCGTGEMNETVTYIVHVVNAEGRLATIYV